MKTKLLKLALFAVASVLPLGASAATETYDFKNIADSYVSSGNAIKLTNEADPGDHSNRIAWDNSKGIGVFKLSFSDGNGYINNFNDRFACATGKYSLRNNGAYQGLWNQGNYDHLFAILDLKIGDKVTITQKSGETNYFSYQETYSTSGILSLSDGTSLESGTEYIVQTDGNLVLRAPSAGIHVEMIVIEHPVTSVPVTVGVAGYSNEYNFKGLGEETLDISEISPLTSAGGETFENRFEFASGVKTTDVQFTKNYGLKILWAHKLFYIKDLKVGEKVTINFTTTAINISGTSILNDVADNGVITSGTPYTVKTAGDLILDNQGKNTTIEDITISKAGLGGATLVSEYALDFTNVSEIKAYVATAASAGTVRFNRVYKVAAETPLYLKADAVVSVDVPVLNDDPETIDTNLLKGYASATTPLTSTDDTKYYVFGVLDDEAGFYPVSTEGTLTSAAGKAYLELTASQVLSARSIKMVFNDVTDISTVKVNEANEIGDNNWYTLQGARVAKPTHGIYIRNGKKIFIK